MGIGTGTANLLPAAIHALPEVTSLADGDELLVWQTSDGTLAKITKANSGIGTGGGSGAPTDAPYLLTSSSKTLTGSSVIAAGDGVTISTASGTTTVSANVAAGSGISQSTSKGTITTALNIHGLTSATSLNLTDELPIYDGTGNRKTTLQDVVDLANAGTTTPTVTITTTVEGQAGTPAVTGTNERQILEFQGAPNGSLSVTFGGQTANFADVTTDIEASNVDTSLEALSSIGASNLTCTDSGSGALPRDVTVEFVGDLAEASQSLMTLAPTLTSSALNVSVVETTAGEAGASLVEVWKLDEAGETDDRTGEMGVADLTSDNAAVGIGKDGACLTSGGSNNYLTTAPTAGLGFGATSARSISAWIRVDNVANETLLEWSCGATSLQIKKYDDAGPLKFRAVAETSTGQTIVTSSSAFDTGQWHFVVASWDGTNVGLSVDGAAFETSARGGNMATGNATVTASAFNSDRVDEPALWSVAMSAESASALWNGGMGDFYPYADSGTSEVQTITLTGSPSWGSFTLSFGGETSSNISYNSNAATVQAALRALTGLSAVTCSGDLGGGMAVTFPSSMGNVALLTCDYSRLLCRVRRVQAGQAGVAEVPGVNEEQTVEITGAGGGTFLLDFDGTSIGPIDWDTDAAGMQTAFDDAAVDATVTGSNPFTVEFTGANAATNVPEMTADASGLTATSNRPASHRFEVSDWVDEGSGVYSATFEAAEHQKGGACMLQVQVLQSGRWRVATDEFDVGQDDTTDDVVVLVSGGSGSRCVIRVFVV